VGPPTPFPYISDRLTYRNMLDVVGDPGSSQCLSCSAASLLTYLPMPLDWGNRGAAVFRQPFDVDASAQTHADKLMARAVRPSRPDLNASWDSIQTNTAAASVKVKRVAFLIQKDVIVLGSRQRL
jgi:hypothetical protein